MTTFLSSLLCKLPLWLGGGHKEKRVPVSAIIDRDNTQIIGYNRECKRCGATRLTRPRKAKA
jgi:hypothetical protein